MGRGLFKAYCIAIVSLSTLFNMSSCSSSGTSTRGWGSGFSSGGWSSGGGHK
ncbi:hypothetical protein [Chitinilyticum aquatile]|uniref:hypothetical protein n=1 Tax=Chitinilyticum aquatile TaxID=362520 RepID=UPI00041C6F64|nr:hypothetical protein [Chitinilyticum aquatile]